MKLATQLLILLMLAATATFAQTKTDTTKVKPPASITLNLDKLGARFQQFQSDVAECDKQIEAWTAKKNMIIGKMQGYNEAANDSTLRVTEAKKK